MRGTSNYIPHFHPQKYFWKCPRAKRRTFYFGPMCWNLHFLPKGRTKDGVWATLFSRPLLGYVEATTSFDMRCLVWLTRAWWRHQMETFSALLAICAGNSPSPVTSPHKGQWRGALMFSLICVWINGWVNNHEAGDLRRYRAHYDVKVMGRWRSAVWCSPPSVWGPTHI